MRRIVIAALVAFVAFATVSFAQSNVAPVVSTAITAPVLSTNTPTVLEVKEHVNLWKSLVAGIKTGGWGYVVGNLLIVILLVLGSARLIARILEVLLGFIVRLTPGKEDDAWFTGKFLPAIAKIIAWTTDVSGWLSLTFGRKGTDVIENAK